MLNKFIKRVAKKISLKRLGGGFLQKLSKDPLNADLHLQYACYANVKKHPYLAFSELKTAEFLGAGRDNIHQYKSAIQSSLPALDKMNHNQYFRFNSLASELKYRCGKDNFSVLDVGGGMGELAAFIPAASYCLAEPSVNGISGTKLPFPDHSFDIVVSCHVLEHIPLEKRDLFLDQLLSKAQYGLILLNPFHINGSHVEERLKLVIEVTDAEWAKEHLACSLPTIADIEYYAKRNNLKCCIKPNGSLATSLAQVFVDYFSSKYLLKSDWEKVNQFFNLKFDNDILDSDNYPNAYIVYLQKSDQEQ